MWFLHGRLAEKTILGKYFWLFVSNCELISFSWFPDTWIFPSVRCLLVLFLQLYWRQEETSWGRISTLKLTSIHTCRDTSKAIVFFLCLKRVEWLVCRLVPPVTRGQRNYFGKNKKCFLGVFLLLGLLNFTQTHTVKQIWVQKKTIPICSPLWLRFLSPRAWLCSG